MMCMSSCGGIKGGNTTFDESLKMGISPKLSSLTCSAIFSKYIFDILKNETKDFVDISLLMSQSHNPLTLQYEKYLSIGLLSSEDGKNHREPINLILVLDISGSMGSGLDYKAKGNKLDLAKSCVKSIYSKLKDEETLGVITFNNNCQTILELQTKKSIDKKKFFDKIDELKATGGTSIEVGYHPAVLMMQNKISEDSKDSKNFHPTNHRIIFITDALINNTDEADMLYKINFESSAKPLNIFTTFIGVGIDFNTDLISRLTKIRGSNYFSVHSDEEFKKTLENDFNYIVTPLCFDVYVKVESKKFEIERTYGSEFDFEGMEKADSQIEMKKGGVLRLETLSAYEKTKGGLKGGVVLVKLKEKEEKNDEIKEDYQIIVSIEFEDIQGQKKIIKKEIDGKLMENKEIYPSTGVRKALLLSRYVTFVKNILGNHPEYVKDQKEKEKNEKFLLYFEEEMKVLKDKTLEEEHKNLNEVLKLKV